MGLDWVGDFTGKGSSVICLSICVYSKCALRDGESKALVNSLDHGVGGKGKGVNV